jgi:hypothetical protein
MSTSRSGICTICACASFDSLPDPLTGGMLRPLWHLDTEVTTWLLVL